MIRFDKLRIPAFILSFLLVIIGVWFFSGLKVGNLGPFTPKGFNLSIDFQGGLVHQLTVYTGISQEEIRNLSIEAGLGSDVQNVIIPEKKRIGKATSYLIKTMISKDDQEKINNDPNLTPSGFLSQKIDKLYSLIKTKYAITYILKGQELAKANELYPDPDIPIPGEIVAERTVDKRVLENVVKESENSISPVYSKGLRLQAILLVIFVLFAMLVYISIRFKFKYALGAVLALLHDTTITLGFISLNSLEFDYTLIGAVLFIIGYSVNDTIVIFDRIRENFGIMKEASAREIVNTSINQSLTRTILTSLTTLLAVIALFVWGGPKVYGFSITLIFGIVIGTYSSNFIASPVVEGWDKLFVDKKTRLKELKKEELMEKRNIVENKNEEVETAAAASADQQSASQAAALSKKQLMKLSGKKKKR